MSAPDGMLSVAGSGVVPRTHDAISTSPDITIISSHPASSTSTGTTREPWSYSCPFKWSFQ